MGPVRTSLVVPTINDSSSGPQPNLSASTELLYSTATALEEGMLAASARPWGLHRNLRFPTGWDLFCLPGLATTLF